MSGQHIAIPYDELELFKQEEKYQHYLVETLIYSTKVSLHNNNNKIKCILVITKNTLWIEEETKGKKRINFPMKQIVDILKCEDHPQMVIFTQETCDNLRVSTANEERAQNIISVIAFYFTYLAAVKRPLKVYTIKQNSLLYFERSVKEKKTGPKFNLDRYTCTAVTYVESKETPDLYGKLVIQRMVLVKQLYVEGSHLVHIAKLNDKQYFICNTIDKNQAHASAIRKHVPLDFVQTLHYSRLLQYKIQLFFEFMPSLKPGNVPIPLLYREISELYDKMRKISPNAFLTPNMLCYQQNEQKQINKLYLREFRYDFLLYQHNINRLIYVKIYKQKTPRDYLINKMYNIGMILYHFLFGRAPFDHEDFELIVEFKNSAKIEFPNYMNVSYSKRFREFIERCLLGYFKTEEEVKEHHWIKQSHIYT